MKPSHRPDYSARAAALRDASFNPLSPDGDTSKEGAKGQDTLGSSAVAVV
jgi:hypothetical protein